MVRMNQCLIRSITAVDWLYMSCWIQCSSSGSEALGITNMRRPGEDACGPSITFQAESLLMCSEIFLVQAGFFSDSAPNLRFKTGPI